MSGLPETHRAVLGQLCSRLEDTGAVWAITGSTSFALQGVPVQPHDVDVQTDRAGAYEIEKGFADAVLRPVRYSRTDRMASHFGALRIGEIEVEIMGDIEKRLPDGTWMPPPDLPGLIRFVEDGGLRVPVVDLVYEAEAYEALGRHDRAAMLRRWLEEQ